MDNLQSSVSMVVVAMTLIGRFQPKHVPGKSPAKHFQPSAKWWGNDVVLEVSWRQYVPSDSPG
jgi:hypothetical protein